MFSEKKDKKAMEPSSKQNRINEGTHLKGDITSEGFFRIDGTIEGTITTPSKVVLGKSGKIIGNLNCKDADIEGTFEGNLDVSGVLSLKASAIIEGDVVVGKLAVEPGATFNATCTMKGSERKKEKVTASDKEKAHPYDRSQRIKKTTTEQSN